MPTDALRRIADEYPAALTQDFAGHPLAQFIRHDLPETFAAALPQHDRIIWHASAGQGQWADAPWLAAFDPIVTDSAQRKDHPVFLFSRSIDRIYISLNQGMTEIRQEFSDDETVEILAHRASILRSRLADSLQDTFNTDPIDLQPTGPHTRLAMYQPGHAIGKVYRTRELPTPQQLIADTSRMLDLYYLATERGGTDEFDVGQPAPDPLQPDFKDMTMEEIRRYRYHRSIERNPRLATEAKRIHGYTCQVCQFNFEETYGELGHEYIEAHHLTPLADLPIGRALRLSPRDDFAVVCANCHRMIHRSGAPPDFADFVRRFSRE